MHISSSRFFHRMIRFPFVILERVLGTSQIGLFHFSKGHQLCGYQIICLASDLRYN